MKKLFLAVFLFCGCASLFAQDIMLSEPTKTGGKPLMEAFSERQTKREFVKKEIPVSILSDLLWSAYGFNREDKRTVPSSQNRQEIDVYVVLDNGIYFYDAKANILKLHQSGDFKEALGQPNITDNAALTLVYVANIDKASNREAGFIDTGFSVQNVYLYAATAGLGTVARGSFKRPDLHKAMMLTDKQEITLVQAVGYPQ